MLTKCLPLVAVIALLCAGCASVLPQPVSAPSQETGIPVAITNGDDEAAEVEVTLYNPLTGQERTTMETTTLTPGDGMTIRVEPTRDRDDHFHVIINGFVAASSEFAGCAVGQQRDPLPSDFTIVVLPNGEPDACSHN